MAGDGREGKKDNVSNHSNNNSTTKPPSAGRSDAGRVHLHTYPTWYGRVAWRHIDSGSGVTDARQSTQQSR
jgi:hypothetical protein